MFQKNEYLSPLISEELYARAIGWEILKYTKEYNLHNLARQIDSDAVALLGEIKAILDDPALDDPACFYRVDALVRAFHRHSLTTDRHEEVN